MVTVILIPSTTEGSLKVFFVVINQRCHHAVEIVVESLLSYYVALYHWLIDDTILFFYITILGCPQSVVSPLGVNLVLLIVAVTTCVVQSDIESKIIGESLVEQQLIVLLMIVVSLVVIELVIIPCHGTA